VQGISVEQFYCSHCHNGKIQKSYAWILFKRKRQHQKY
jgi:hypothetical protein